MGRALGGICVSKVNLKRLLISTASAVWNHIGLFKTRFNLMVRCYSLRVMNRDRKLGERLYNEPGDAAPRHFCNFLGALFIAFHPHPQPSARNHGAHSIRSFIFHRVTKSMLLRSFRPKRLVHTGSLPRTQSFRRLTIGARRSTLWSDRHGRAVCLSAESRSVRPYSSSGFPAVGDTIYALSTAQGRAGIAVIRISGPSCLDVSAPAIANTKSWLMTFSDLQGSMPIKILP